MHNLTVRFPAHIHSPFLRKHPFLGSALVIFKYLGIDECGELVTRPAEIQLAHRVQIC